MVENRIKNRAITMKGIECKPLHINANITEIKKKIKKGITAL